MCNDPIIEKLTNKSMDIWIYLIKRFNFEKKFNFKNFKISKSIDGVTFFFDNSSTGHFSVKIFSDSAPLGHLRSNDTGVKFLSCPGAESIKGQTNTHTEWEFYDILIKPIDWNLVYFMSMMIEFI
jgi:hypothetical protein